MSGPRRFSGVGVVLAAASGFLAGVLLVAALGGAKGRSERTVTVSRTVQRTLTVPVAATNPGTVIVTTAVPDVTGQPLHVADKRIARAGFELDVDGGGVLGVVVRGNWRVVAQDPPAGTELEQGSVVTVQVERR